MPPKRTTDTMHQEDPKQQKPRAGLLNEIMLEDAWIGYWDDDAWTSYPKELGTRLSPWFQRFPGRISSYIDLIDRSDQVDYITLADTQPFAEEEKRGSWRSYYKSNAADPVEPTLVSLPFCPNSSIWAYKFSTNVGEDRRTEVFAIFRKEKANPTVKGVSQEKYTYLLRDEMTYSEHYFIYVPKVVRVGRWVATPKKARGGENHGPSEQSDGQYQLSGTFKQQTKCPEAAEMRHQRHPKSRQNGIFAEATEGPGGSPPTDVANNAPAELSQNSELGDAEQILRQFLPATTHSAGTNRERSETIRPDALPQQQQQHCSRAFIDDALPSTEYAEFQEYERTPGPAARSKRSFPNMQSSHTTTTSSAAGNTPEQEPQNAQGAGGPNSEVGQKRQRDQEFEIAEAGSMLPPEIPSKRLKRRTVSSGDTVIGNPEPTQDRELLQEAEATLHDEAAVRPSNSLAQSTPPASPDPEQREALMPADVRPRAISKTPPQQAGRNVPTGATLSIRTSATPTTPNKAPYAGLVFDVDRAMLKLRVEDGNSCDYAMWVTDCHNVQELFRKATKSVKRELNEGDAIHSLLFYIDRTTEMDSAETWIDLDDKAANYYFAMRKISDVLRVKAGVVEIFVLVEVTRRR